jgi:hypothetical protein
MQPFSLMPQFYSTLMPLASPGCISNAGRVNWRIILSQVSGGNNFLDRSYGIAD